MRSICLIPARGGSKRIPRKNLKLFFGKPLILWSIEAALSSGIFDEIYVSTDDIEIAEIAASNGANIPFLRPKNISNDYAVDQDVIDHFLGWMKENKIAADNLCYLYATAPFITRETLIGVRKLLEESEAYMAHTITKYDFPVLKALKKDKNDCLKYMWNEYSKSRSQDLSEFFHDAGQCYFFDLKKSYVEKKIVGYILPRLYCQDIDTIEDFEQAEIIYEHFLRNKT
tara:strand:- start:15 stop:698 length:684 start_codon:yes stop_codon:yes gene_type:complete